MIAKPCVPPPSIEKVSSVNSEIARNRIWSKFDIVTDYNNCMTGFRGEESSDEFPFRADL